MATPPKRVDRRVQRTRQLLRQAAIEIMQEKGFLEMTIQNIADRANVNRGTFYAHFADKYALLDEIIRESRYLGYLLCSKNATRGSYGKGKPTTIRQTRRRLIDSLTEDSQITIEHAVVEWAKFDLNERGVLRDRTWELKKRQQSPPGGLRIGWWKIVVTHPHCQIRQRHFTHSHDLILPMIQFIHDFLLCF